MKSSTLLNVAVTTASMTLTAFAFNATVEAASLYSVTDLGTFQATRINNTGQVVGTDSNGASLWQNGSLIHLENLGNAANTLINIDINNQGDVVFGSFLWRNGTVINLGENFYANSINDLGIIAGSIGLGDLFSRAAKWQDGTITELNLPPNYSSRGSAINNVGQIGVNSNVTVQNSTEFHTGIWQNEVTTELDLTLLIDLNNSGRAIGNYTDSNGFEQAHTWYNGKTTDLGSLGGEGTWSYGLNNLDQIVGVSNTQDWVTNAFIWDKGVMENLNNLLVNGEGWELEWATDINDNGQIIGWGRYNGVERSFLLNPMANNPDNPQEVPEPTVGFSLLAIAALGMLSRKGDRP
ncbi:MAG: hypothetical protein SAJ12_05240 [Jaaginema sp. PMC 1079.18]|nr:hypothetical protein [Jaaginema sp. PMC 1080.18]MEC4850397.1 hypothetical protein [Jaaginema sp. PMC 1079.18]MEC4865134.1 hypothetical protein [Jaaginema sp. PMC 1078.18]